LDWLTPEEKLVFRTAYEIDQKVILRLASQRQRYIDQAQSLNLFFSADESEEYIAEVHAEFLLDPRLKSLYYMRTLAGVQAAKDECVACT
jgi:ribonucleoside-diphosphate reductase alpha chain